MISVALAAVVASPLAAMAFTRGAFDRTAFDAAQKAGGPVLLHVSATWCGTCAAQRAVLDKLDGNAAFKPLTLFSIDYDTEKAVMRSFDVRERSTLIAFKAGREVGRLVGETQEGAIKALLEKAL